MENLLHLAVKEAKPMNTFTKSRSRISIFKADVVFISGPKQSNMILLKIVAVHCILNRLFKMINGTYS